MAAEQNAREELIRFLDQGAFEPALRSTAAQRVQRELEQLGLPTVRDIENAFEGLCQDLGIGR